MQTRIQTPESLSLTLPDEICVKARDEKYRGFLLYATNTKGDKIGSWELPPEKKIDFHTPPGAKPGSCSYCV